MMFRYPDLPKYETDAVLIQPSRRIEKGEGEGMHVYVSVWEWRGDGESGGWDLN